MKTIRFSGFDDGCPVTIGAVQGALSDECTLPHWRQHVPAAFAEADWSVEASGTGFTLTVLAPPCGKSRPPDGRLQHRCRRELGGAAGDRPAATTSAEHSDARPIASGAKIPVRLRCVNDLGAGAASADKEITTAAAPVTESPVTESVGSVAITVTRSIDQVAPDPVMFEATDHLGFALPPRTAVGVWNPAWHRLLHVWDFGPEEAGSFDAVPDLIPEHNDKRHAYGPKVFHVYETPGDKTVTLRLYDLSGALVHEKAVTFTVGDANKVFAGSRTIAVDPAAQPCLDVCAGRRAEGEIGRRGAGRAGRARADRADPAAGRVELYLGAASRHQGNLPQSAHPGRRRPRQARPRVRRDLQLRRHQGRSDRRGRCLRHLDQRRLQWRFRRRVNGLQAWRLRRADQHEARAAAPSSAGRARAHRPTTARRSASGT